MNRKMVFYMIGKIVQAEAAMLLLPLVVALLYKETPLPFLITIGIALVLGIALSLIFKPKDRVIYAKEGFVIVAFAWIALSLIGCIPFVLSGALPNFFDAFFEKLSKFACVIHKNRGGSTRPDERDFSYLSTAFTNIFHRSSHLYALMRSNIIVCIYGIGYTFIQLFKAVICTVKKPPILDRVIHPFSQSIM